MRQINCMTTCIWHLCVHRNTWRFTALKGDWDKQTGCYFSLVYSNVREPRQGGGEQVLTVLLKSLMENGLIVWTGFIWEASVWNPNVMSFHKRERFIWLSVPESSFQSINNDAGREWGKQGRSLPQQGMTDILKVAWKSMHLTVGQS